MAPTLCVRIRRRFWFWWSHETRVIDPSLFTQPVSTATWKSVQGDPGAVLTDKPGWVFYKWPNSDETDPTYTKTDGVLADHRLYLKLRSLGPDGPPPYAACP